MLVMIEGPMINRFIEDGECFRKCVDNRFHELDSNGDGFLSRTDIANLVFSSFDVDRIGSIDREEFRPLVMEMLIAVARGIGPTPVSVGVEEDSLLVRVYEHDLARVEKSSREIRRSYVIGGKALWRKMRSKKMLKICVCCYKDN